MVGALRLGGKCLEEAQEASARASVHPGTASSHSPGDTARDIAERGSKERRVVVEDAPFRCDGDAKGGQELEARHCAMTVVEEVGLSQEAVDHLAYPMALTSQMVEVAHMAVPQAIGGEVAVSRQ